MRRPGPLIAAAALALVIGACGGGNDPEPTPSPEPNALPPAFVRCMAEQGFPVDSPDEVHSAPQQVLQECFGALHEGGGGSPRR